MKRLKDNKIIDLKNKDEKEKNTELGKISKQINEIFCKEKKE